jgi:hypothetical protein
VNLDKVVRVITLMDEKSNLGDDIADVRLILAPTNVKHPLLIKQDLVKTSFNDCS